VPVRPGEFRSNLTLHAKFLGYTNIFLQTYRKGSNGSSGEPKEESSKVPVSVIRVRRIWDKIFIISVPVLVSLIYINFGCAVNWGVVRDTLKRPVGPAIGFVSQFLFMPMVRITFPAQFNSKIILG
jgi:solute carrier family 10 (sodium/bile acid cotransporter), member 3/5